MARSDTGEFLGASAIRYGGIVDPEVLEAMAVREGVNLAKDMNFSKFMLASDCLSVVKAMTEEKMGTYSHVLEEIKHGVASFQDASVGFESRLSNKEPHNLARLVLSLPVGRHV